MTYGDEQAEAARLNRFLGEAAMTVAPDRLVDLEELRRLAEQASPSEWERFYEDIRRLGSRTPAIRDWLAACTPATILSMLDDWEKALWDVGILVGRVAALEEGLRNLIEAWDKRANYNTGEQVKALIPSIIQARSLLQSSAASQGDEE